MKALIGTIRNRRGGTLVLVAITIVALLGMIALAVDLGMAYTARSEAQRIADAAALAGGSAFLEFSPPDAIQPAEDRAYDYALRNHIRNRMVDSSEVTVQVLQNEMKVRVWITRDDLPTWFARLLGIFDVDVAAMAAAQAVQAGASRCLKPFAVPDIWDDVDDDNDPRNRWWDEGEEWDFDTADGDRYQRYNPNDPDVATATGYGSEWRGPDQDYGREITVKVQDPQDEHQPASGVFLPWVLPDDEDMPECSGNNGNGGGNNGGGNNGGGNNGGDPTEGQPGAAQYRKNICSCNENAVELGVPYEIQTGDMKGPTYQGIDDLIDQDPNAEWDPLGDGGRGAVVNSDYTDWFDSPRVVRIALYDPTQFMLNPGKQDIEFNNFALFFIEEQEGNNPGQAGPVTGRFLYFVSGEEGGGPVTGPLVLYLRLVE